MGLTFIARRMCLKYNMLVKRLGTIETLGSISLLASDKTGTLTQNKMVVTSLINASRLLEGTEVVTEGSSKDEFLSNNLVMTEVEKMCVLCNQAEIDASIEAAKGPDEVLEDGKRSLRVAIGSNATDRALLMYVEEKGMVDTLKTTHSVLATLPFSSTTKLTATVVENDSTGDVCVYVKGAPEYILPLCSHYIAHDESVVAKDDQFAAKVLTFIDQDANKGRRIIALAQLGPLNKSQYPENYRYDVDPQPNFPMHGFTFVSAVSVSDPPRVGVKEAVAGLRTAGIAVAMVTGDAANTATAIARAVGIVSHNGPVDTIACMGATAGDPQLVDSGKDGALESYRSNESFTTTCPSIAVTGTELLTVTAEIWDYIFSHKELVFARTTPDQKLLIVKESQRRGHRVCVTGDGVNDSPALRKADVGLAMKSGSDVAKDVASMVLLTDDFTTITEGVREGRLIFENLRKTIAYQISAGCWAELLPVLATFFLGLPQPLSSFLMIMISCFSDVYAGCALMTGML